MLEGILQGLVQWIYGLFLDLMNYCADALLGVMSTDLQFFEDSVPIVPTLYGIFVAVGWGLLIGNCAFQGIKAMFAGFGFETESPPILLLRTFLFGFLLIFADSICEIGLSLGKRVIDLLGIPESIALTMPEESMFSGAEAPWLLVVIIGFILGFQLIKLFFEIAERYVLVGILTMLYPVGLAFGGSKSTKDICTGFIRTYASMIVMMVMNVLFLKLILSALATIPTGALILPWCLLVVGIARTARKADQLISRIGLSPAITGDPLGVGRGLMATAMAARTIMSVVGKARGGKVPGGSQRSGGGSTGGSGRTGNSTYHSSSSFGSSNGTNIHSSKNGTHVGGNHTNVGALYGAPADSSYNSQRIQTSSNMRGSSNTANHKSGATVRFGSNAYTGGSQSAQSNSSRTQFSNTGKVQTSTNVTGGQTGVNRAAGISNNGNNQMVNAHSGGTQLNNNGKAQINGNHTGSKSGTNQMGSISNIGNNQAGHVHSGRVQFNSSGKTQVNTNRFGNQLGTGASAAGGNVSSIGAARISEPERSYTAGTANPAGAPQQSAARPQFGQTGQAPKTTQPGPTAKSFGNTGGKTIQATTHTVAKQQNADGKAKQTQKNASKPSINHTGNSRFGSGQNTRGVHQNAKPTVTGAKKEKSNFGAVHAATASTKNTVKPDVISNSDGGTGTIQNAGSPPIVLAEDGETDG